MDICEQCEQIHDAYRCIDTDSEMLIVDITLENDEIISVEYSEFQSIYEDKIIQTSSAGGPRIVPFDYIKKIDYDIGDIPF